MSSLEIGLLVLAVLLMGACALAAGLTFGPLEWFMPAPHRLPKAPPQATRRDLGAGFAEDHAKIARDIAQVHERIRRDTEQMHEKLRRDIERTRQKVARDQAILRERMEKDRARMRSGQRTGRPFPHDPVTVFQNAMADFVREANADVYEPPPVTKPALSPEELALKEAFRTVGLAEHASEANIRAHRKNQLGHFHPDKWPEGKERRFAEQTFKRLNGAFQVIFDAKGWA